MKQPKALRRQVIIPKRIPSRQVVLEYLTDANRRNPGPWHKHSLLAGEAAGLIAARCPRLDPDVAYTLAAMHDIGRREGVSHMHHTIAGYNFMIEEGFESIARVCLTHSFPIKEVQAYDDGHDCSDDEI